MNIHLTLLLIYSIGLIAFGLWIARLVRTSGDFFVAGRRLSAPLLFSTVLAANIGAGTTIGAAGLAYQDGISAWWWNGSAAIGSFVLAFWVGPKIWKIAAEHNLYTAGDYLELRYGRAVRGVIASLVWLGTLSILAGQLIAGAAVLSVVADVPRWVGTVASALVMTVLLHGRRSPQLSVGQRRAAGRAVRRVRRSRPDCHRQRRRPGRAGGAGSGIAGISRTSSIPRAPARGSRCWRCSARDSSSPLDSFRRCTERPANGPSVSASAHRHVSRRSLASSRCMLGMAARVAHPGIANPNLVLPTVLVEQMPPVSRRTGARGDLLGGGQHVRRDPLHAGDVVVAGSL